MLFKDPRSLGDLFGAMDSTEPQTVSGDPCMTDADGHPLYQQHSIVMASDEDIKRALAKDANTKRVMAKGLKPASGDLVGVRLNLNVLKSSNVLVQTLHAGNQSGGHRKNRGFYNGSALWYQKVVTLTDAYFNVSQTGREKIASGAEAKYPMASVDGHYLEVAEPDFNGIELRFNPKQVHLFVDNECRPVRWAQEVTIYGNRAYARGRMEYYSEQTAPAKVGESSSLVHF